MEGWLGWALACGAPAGWVRPGLAAVSGPASRLHLPLYFPMCLRPVPHPYRTCTAAYDQASPQYAWLLRDLAAVDSSRTPWVVAVQHAPWYNSNYAHQVCVCVCVCVCV